MKEGRVLVVDDEPMVRETLGQVLSDEGYVVDLAVDGETALERVHATRPDAILLDLMMPGMNGRQFLQALREEPAYARVPVMIMTAVHGLEVNLATLGASEVVEKPFNVDELLNKVALAVYRSRESSGLTSHPGIPSITLPPPMAPEKDRGVVLLVEHDRSRLQQLDMMLSARGFNVVPIIFPGVAENQSRLRFFLTSRHSAEQMAGVLDAVAEELPQIRKARSFVNVVSGR